MVKLIGITDSFRKRLYNPALFRAIEKMFPPGVEMGIFACDGVLFVSSEYNHSISGILKKIIAWVSHLLFKFPMAGNPGAIGLWS